MLTLSQFGENPCVMGRTHQNCQLPSFLSFLPNHLFCQEVVEVVIAWKGKSMGNFEWGRALSYGVLCFACRDKKTLEPYVSLTRAFMPGSYSHVFQSCGTFSFIIIHPIRSWNHHINPPRPGCHVEVKGYHILSFVYGQVEMKYYVRIGVDLLLI